VRVGRLAKRGGPMEGCRWAKGNVDGTRRVGGAGGVYGSESLESLSSGFRRDLLCGGGGFR
jgi:hypothetical protein